MLEYLNSITDKDTIIEMVKIAQQDGIKICPAILAVLIEDDVKAWRACL